MSDSVVGNDLKLTIMEEDMARCMDLSNLLAAVLLAAVVWFIYAQSRKHSHTRALLT